MYTGVRCDSWCLSLRGDLLPVLVLAMGCQQPRRQLQLKLWTLNSPLLTLPKGWTHACNPPHIRQLRVTARNIAGLKYHPNRF